MMHGDHDPEDSVDEAGKALIDALLDRWAYASTKPARQILMGALLSLLAAADGARAFRDDEFGRGKLLEHLYKEADMARSWVLDRGGSENLAEGREVGFRTAIVLLTNLFQRGVDPTP